MKNYTTLWAFLFSIVFYAQDRVDSFKVIIDTTTNKQKKLQYLDSLIKYTGSENNFIYYEQYIHLAKKLNEYDKAANKTMLLSEDYMRNGKFAMAEKIIDSIFIEDSLKLKKSTISHLYKTIGEINFNKSNYSKAITNFKKADSIANKSKDSLFSAKLNLRIGQTYSILENFPEAISSLLKAEKMLNKTRDKYETSIVKFEMATMYSRNSFYDKAKEERDKLKPILLETEEYIFAAGLMLTEANDYHRQKLYEKEKKSLDEAIEYLNKSKINGPRSQGDKNHLSLLINNAYALYYINNKDIDNAIIYFDKANSFNKEAFEKIYRSTLLYTKAKLHKESGSIDDAIKEAKEFLQSSIESQDVDGIINGEELLYELLADQGNYEEAYKYSLHHSKLKDSVENTVKVNTYLYYQKLFEIEESEKKLIQQTANIELLEKDNKEKMRLLVFSISGLVLLFSSVFLYRNRQHLKKEKELQESFSQQLLSSQEEERKRISKDLHDGLGQSLLLIKNKVALNSDDNTKNMFNDAIEEVRTISRALHPFQLEKFGITKAIQNIINELDESSDIFISSEIEDISNILTPEKEVNLYRIVQESISNIIKHSEAEAARVEIQKRPKYIHLRIKDNGKGFDFSEKHNDFKSLGLKTLKERTKFLKGTMKADSEKNKGTTLEFVIPIS